MKLERVSLLAVGVCCAGLVVLLLFGVWANQKRMREHDEVLDLQALHDRLDNITTAAHRLLLSTPDPDELKALGLTALRAQRELSTLESHYGGIALELAEQIEQVQRVLRTTGAVLEHPPEQANAGSAIDDGDAAQRLAQMAIVNQAAIAIDQVLNSLLEERRSITHADGDRLILTFVLATAIFGFVCVASFAYVHRLIAGSISALARSVEQISSGKTYLRVPVHGDDEVGALSGAVNRLLDKVFVAAGKIDEQRQQIERQSELLVMAGEIARVGGWSLTVGEEQLCWSDVVARIHGRPAGFSPTLDGAIGFFAEDDRPRLEKAIADCTEQATPFELSAQINDGSGTRKWVRVAGVPVRSAAGDVVAVQGALQDISDYVRVEQQLQRSQRLESLGQLTGGIAHDFNNNLTVIIGNAELLMEECAHNADLSACAKMIRDGAERGARLTQQLLSFARRQTLTPQIVCIDTLLGGLRDLLGRALGEDIALQLSSDADLWPCWLDSAQLENAVLNLVINAREAMPRGGQLTLATRNVSFTGSEQDDFKTLPAGDYVQLAVSDTGEGIPSANIDRLFEPFFTTRAHGRGTGLGLPMVYGFVTQSAGFIDVTSTPGKGTVITIHFPRHSGTAEAGEPAEPLARVQAPRGKLQRILLVEDDDLVRAYVEQQLLTLGYRVISAAGGSEALQILRGQEDIDLLLTDVVMPGGMNGRELAEAAAREKPGLKILYTSGYSRDVISRDGLLDDGIELLRKPYRREELAHKLNGILGSPI